MITTKMRERNRYRTNFNSTYNKLYTKYRLSAKCRNLVFTLTQDEWHWLVLSPCYYCGMFPNRIFNPYLTSTGKLRSEKRKFKDWNMEKLKKFSVKYNGIDRFNNDFGYVSKNVVPCCTDCNYLKNNVSQVKFLKWVKRVAIFNTSEVE